MRLAYGLLRSSKSVLFRPGESALLPQSTNHLGTVSLCRENFAWKPSSPVTASFLHHKTQSHFAENQAAQQDDHRTSRVSPSEISTVPRGVRSYRHDAFHMSRHEDGNPYERRRGPVSSQPRHKRNTGPVNMRADLELGKGEREMLSRLEPEAIVRKILSYETKEEVFAFLGATYLPIKTTFLMLQDLRKCGAQHRCLEVAHWARAVELPLKNIHYTVLLGACRDLKDAKQAETLLYEMGDRKEANIINYNAFFAVCAAAGDLKTAMRVFEEMKLGAKFRPDNVTFSTLLHICKQVGDWERADALFKEMQDKYKILPDTILYGALIAVMQRAKHWEMALALLDEMRGRRVMPNVIVYNAAIGACCRANQIPKALEVLASMRAAAVRPNAITYGSLLTECSAQKQWTTAMALTKEAETDGVPLDYHLLR